MTQDSKSGAPTQGVKMERPPLTWNFGASEKVYGAQIWVARIKGLESHFRIIRDHLPEDANYLRNQVEAALNEARRYIEDYAPVTPAESECDDRPEWKLRTGFREEDFA